MKRRPDALILVAALALGFMAAAPRSSVPPAGYPVETTPAASASPTASLAARDPEDMASGTSAARTTGAPSLQNETPGPRPSASSERVGAPSPPPGQTATASPLLLDEASRSPLLVRAGPATQKRKRARTSPSISPASHAPARRPARTLAPAQHPAARSGLASTYGAGWSEWWVALPDGPGWRFRVCGAGGCRELVSHDAGPDLAMQREGRIVDLPIGAFEDVCGVPWRMGLCQVTLTILGRA